MRRPKLKFRQAAIHRWLVKNGPATNKMVAAEFGLTQTAAQKMTERLRKKGRAARSGPLRDSLWTAVGDTPEDWRGTSVGSQTALETHGNWRYAVTKMLTARGINPQQYPSLSSVSECTDNRPVLQNRREGTPGEVPHVPTLGSLGAMLLAR